jgi:signal transduction histidine kinase
VELDRLAEEVCEMFRPSAEQAGLQLNLEVSGEPPPVTGDPDRLRQVIENLLGNALKFTEKGEVAVRLRAEDPSWVILEVADTGVGISQKNLEHIFEDFFRAKDTRSDGSGLGLAIAHRLVEAHGGRIEAESTPGKGSAFTVHLPAADKQGH